MPPISRRRLLAASLPTAVAMATLGGGPLFAQTAGARFGPSRPFSFEGLRHWAKSLAERPFAPPKAPAPEFVSKIDFDMEQRIRFRPERTLWADGTGAYPVRLFHLNKFNGIPVRIYTLSDGMARQVLYSPADFDYTRAHLAGDVPDGLGYSGFRLMAGPGKDTDWLAFQGSTYFRTSGQENQYGASARGIAVDTAVRRAEEFPRFIEFWIEEPEKADAPVTVYTLLDGPSVTGVYRFDARREHGAIVDAHAELFIRKDIERLGIAPLTSMYWYGENDRRQAVDWRPEIHDNDGLALWTGGNERLWRPLINPPSLQVHSFVDDNPKGFGLLQRDRDFDNYQDDSVFYERRPSVWVEPKGDWGEGAVQLVEIPTDDEIYDNIVAFWKPKRPARKGDNFTFDYRLHWRNRQPFPPDDLALVAATRTGRGGVPGQPRQEDAGTKFVIDFESGPLAGMGARHDLVAAASASRGEIVNPYVIKIVGTERWRAVFDLRHDGKDPVDLRCLLRLGDRTLSETWLYQFFPATS